MSCWRAFVLLLAALPLLAASGCASLPPPNEEISNAELALREADSINAVEHAPLQMRIAREKLDEAKALVRKGEDEDMVEARRLAEQALVEAQLADQTARAEIAEQNRKEAQATIETMRRESGLNRN